MDQFVHDDGELAFRDAAVIAVDGGVLRIIYRRAIGIGIGEWFLISEKRGAEPDVAIEGLSPTLPSQYCIRTTHRCGGRNIKQRLPDYTHECDTVLFVFAKVYGLFDVGTTLVIYADKHRPRDGVATLGFSGPARYIPKNILHRMPLIIVGKENQEGILGRILGRDSDGRNDCIGDNDAHLSKEPDQNFRFVLEATHENIIPIVLETCAGISNDSPSYIHVLDFSQTVCSGLG